MVQADVQLRLWILQNACEDQELIARRAKDGRIRSNGREEGDEGVVFGGDAGAGCRVDGGDVVDGAFGEEGK